MSADVLSPVGTTKFSRYQSVKKAAARQNSQASQLNDSCNHQRGDEQFGGDEAEGEQLRSPQPDALARSRSRYRRARPSTAPSQDHVPPISSNAASGAQRPTTSRARDTSGLTQEMPRQGRNRVKSGAGQDSGESTRQKERDVLLLKQNQDREWEQRLEQIKQRELERLEAELSRVKVVDNSPIQEEKPKLSLLRRLKTGKNGGSKRELGGSRPESQSPSRSKDRSSTAPAGIEPGGAFTGRIPGTDAPVSAVNSGERRVKVRCNESMINVPVLPETTTSDVLRSAVNDLGLLIHPDTALLLESFTQLGLERPLRKYERVRETLNSWDRDAQNGLILVPSTSGEFDGEALKVRNVPSEPPEVSVYLYYSQKPRKWNKRWVTLRADGQMAVAKKLEAKDKEVLNICHMSDFDIYTPTRRQVAKHLKPPKKICFAIKSQQKSSVFLSTANFVHFFATSDKAMAAQFYQAVQSWRSWYLVHKKGEGQPQPATNVPMSEPVFNGGSQPPHQRTVSMTRERQRSDQSREQRRSKDVGGGGNHDTPRSGPSTAEATPHARHRSTREKREKRGPPVSYPAHMLTTYEDAGKTGDQDGASPGEVEGATFAPTGLLGRSYSQRQKELAQHDRTSQSDGPFISGPNLLNRGNTMHRQSVENSPQHTKAVRHSSGDTLSKTPSNDIKRASSSRQKPKPLLDFSNPEYREPPQHSKKGKGHGVSASVTGGGALIDAATSPDNPIAIPPATTWRRKPGQHAVQSQSTPGRTNTMRSRAPGRTGTMRRDVWTEGASGDDDGDIDAFTGLLGKLDTAPTPGQGRGVRTGDRDARGPPLMDMNEPSKFAEGSLLRRFEMHHDSGHEEPGSGPGVRRGQGTVRRPVIDRQKRTEVVVGVGEGL